MIEENKSQLPPHQDPVGREWNIGAPEINWDQICFVRALKNEGQIEKKIVENQEILFLPNALNATKGDFNRITIHFAINHLVGNHMYGSWSDSKIVIISPAESLIKQNGLPENLLAVDTFWTQGINIPNNSKIIVFSQQIDTSNQAIDGIEIINLDLDSDFKNLLSIETEINRYIESIKNTNHDLSSDIYYSKIEAEHQDKIFNLHTKMNNQVNQTITDMGYTVLDQEHNGLYMGEENLEKSLAQLAKKNNIKSTELHDDTFYGQVENYLGDYGFIDTISHLKFEKISEYSESTEFSKLINDITCLFDRFSIDTEDKSTVFKIFTSHLYSSLVNLPAITNNDCNIGALQNLFEHQPSVLNLLDKWSENDTQNKVKIVEKINKIKNF